MAGMRCRARIGFLAGEARDRAGVEHLLGTAFDIGLHLLERAHALVIGPDGEVAVAELLLARCGFAALGLPFGETTIENGDIVCAKGAQHEPGARSRVIGRIVVEHDAAAIAQAQRLHPAGELFGARQHRGQIARRIGDFGQIHEHRAGNMRRFIFGSGIAIAETGEIGRVDNAQIVRAQLVCEPFRRHQRVHESSPCFYCP